MGKMTKIKYVVVFVVGCGMWLKGFSLDISPSKYQGGETNHVPYKTDGQSSLFSDPFKWIFGTPHSSAKDRVNAPPHCKVSMDFEPKDFSPQTHSELKVKITVINEGKDKYIFEFSTAQHLEFIVAKDGKEIYRSSQDKEYAQSISSLIANPREKLVFEDSLICGTNSVLKLEPGKYTFTGKVTSKSPLSIEKTFQVVEPK